MRKWIRLAFRNILRNRRRTLITLLAVSVGFAAVSLFRGYIHNTYSGLRNSAIKGEGLGHLTIYKTGWLENGTIDPDRYMFTREETDRVTALVRADKDVVLASPRLHISGLVSNGTVSTIFMAAGVVPRDDRTIKAEWADFRPIEGKPLDDDTPYGVEMAEGLARHLGLHPGSDGVIMASTLDGQMNAMDILVSGVYDSGSDATNDKIMRVPFSFAQALYDTEKVDRIVVLLDDWHKTADARAHLTALLTEAGLSCEIKTWDELSLFYGKVRGMFGMIFLFLFSIVLIIVVMSTINTMSMAVMERTREIGTLRSLGVKRRGISILFAMEGGMLGVLGSAGGAVFTVIAWAVIRIIQPSYTPPGVSTPVPLIVNLLPQAMLTLTLFMVVLSLGAAIIPARHAAGQNVVDALGHV